ncbi:hypothetical protein Mhun_2656 [Methanospirillum hungatei JF-1]|jgi:nicotinamidase/pyrazinamidase|uniref:Isochorismatase-like domain-containing protein n=1 Tax=Methanospirillum hungatei JF-1 (strain ATCC 27890 / DSM 864 / NBRC 100397 / JF-1) TaxID=323259 RepID=Q2FTF2_METHJ|nr:hypothetical protein [Methanospirillum hungatei]ABD42353.1 hypothetical protein Mhun_2656 [Methanospirillum hungatei JF-1]MBP9008809.1 hypothetical protein [Methanospirillum sp.]OQA58536.1 MAG: Isochorismatase family protein [Euryarchaeota archaeon ADurb.Bin294]HOW04018.1 hypothetical protein [Methanospirillum hungatei]
MSIKKPVRILQIGDMQKGFTIKNGNLYVSGAEDILGPAQEFLEKIPKSAFDYTFVILDTHFSEEYEESEEAKEFPIHCEYQTDDWELSLDVSGLPDTWYLMKNQFTMWGERKGQAISFTNPDRKIAYESLFHFVDDPRHPGQVIPRDSFLHSIAPEHDLANIEVTLFGVASDFCNRFAMEGWLARGAKVTIIKDLTKGIHKETASVLGECSYQRYMPDRLSAISSQELL